MGHLRVSFIRVLSLLWLRLQPLCHICIPHGPGSEKGRVAFLFVWAAAGRKVHLTLVGSTGGYPSIMNKAQPPSSEGTDCLTVGVYGWRWRWCGYQIIIFFSSLPCFPSSSSQDHLMTSDERIKRFVGVGIFRAIKLVVFLVLNPVKREFFKLPCET